MPLHIGIIACSAEGAALCYRTICADAADVLGAHAHPEISLHTHSLADYVACIDRGDWRGVGELMLSSAHRLAAAGADFLICPDNTIHQALPHIDARLPLPWLPIADVVAARAADRGYRRVGVTGTRWLVDSDVYPRALTARGVDCVRPDPADRDVMTRIILDELVRGAVTPRAVDHFRRVIGQLRDRGCDAVVLGCTEIPLVIDAAGSPLPTLDSTRLLARAAVDRAVSA